MHNGLSKTVKKITKPATALFLLLMVALLTGCGPDAVYEDYVEVPESGWYRDSAITFTVEIEDTASPYQVVWYLRNNNDYAYSNIYLFRKVTSQRGVEFSDTAQFALADAYGKWLGKGVGELKTNTWPFKQQLLFFNQEGTYTFTLRQAMRTDYLKGVEDVGLGIFKVTKDNG